MFRPALNNTGDPEYKAPTAKLSSFSTTWSRHSYGAELAFTIWSPSA
jgi:hypothetical protein